MGAILVHEFMSLDGVIDAPTWTSDYGFDPQMGKAIAEAMEGCRGILLGRTTYEMFEPAWSTRTVADDPGAPSSTRQRNTSLRDTDGNDVEELEDPRRLRPDAIRRLKDEVDGDVYVSGSATLVRAMLVDGLVDELHLFLYPLTRGGGPQLFPLRTRR